MAQGRSNDIGYKLPEKQVLRGIRKSIVKKGRWDRVRNQTTHGDRLSSERVKHMSRTLKREKHNPDGLPTDSRSIRERYEQIKESAGALGHRAL